MREVNTAGIEDLHRRARARVFARLVAMRRFFAPLLASLAVWIAIEDLSPWRRGILFFAAGVLGLVALVDVVMHRRLEQRGLGVSDELLLNSVAHRALHVQVGLIAIMQTLMLLATGGIASPLLPMLLPVVFVAAVFLNRPAAAMVAAGYIPMLWVIAIVQLQGVELSPAVFSFVDGHPSQPPGLTITLASLMTLALVMAAFMGGGARDAVDEMLRQALDARDIALASRAEQARELTTLSGEIAHELKNPLASIKGLAALIDRELGRRGEPGKAGERLAVLRHEVDRMQAILDEFLNFSRPLVPLAQEWTDLRVLVGRVLELHEASASEREVRFSLEGEVGARCDPRKVEQIVINLVQNALHVAPPGSRIELSLARRDERARLLVSDEGPGLPAELGERVFEAGVTTKREGSGLGLTVARALARQHGGELELGPRSDGGSGCEARLELPIPGLPEESRV